MKRFIPIVLVLLVIASSWFVWSRGNKPVVVTTPEGYKVTAVIRGPIEARISASGSMAAERTQSLGFASSGTVAEVLVKEGDVVTAKQPLARLDAADLALSVKQAQAALQVSEASLARTKKPATEEDIAAAKAAIDSAQANLADLQSGGAATDVAAAKAAVDSAQASLRDLTAGPSARDIQLANLSIDQAKNSRWGAQASRDSVRAGPGALQGAKDQAESQVLNAEIAVTIAQINRDKLNEPAKESAIKAAQAQVAQAQATLDKLVKPKESTVSAAKSQLAQAEASLARTLNSPSKEDIAQAEAQVAQARVGVEIAQRQLDNAALTAPFAGKVAAINIEVGDTASQASATNPAITLVDDSHYHIDVNIDETEIGRVQVGQKVVVTLDAFPDAQLDGTVAKVSTLGNSSQGIVDYVVRIDVATTDLAIKPLMTASIDIVVERKESVLLVPNRALKRDAQGVYVEVMRNGAPHKIYVTTGVANEENSEVLKGLEAGDQVVVAAPRTNVFSGGAGG